MGEVHFFKLRLTRSIAHKPLKHTLEHLAHSGVPVALGPSGWTRPGLSYTPIFLLPVCNPTTDFEHLGSGIKSPTDPDWT